MSAPHISANQPDGFEFSEQNLSWAKGQIAKYPDGKQASAIIPLLWRAQEQNEGWLPESAINYLAQLLDMAPIRVMEVASFYTMFNMAPVGKYFIQLCGTTPCLLRGSDELVDVLKKRIGTQRQVTKDGLFSWLEVECLGACANAPMVQINKDYFEDLNAENFEKLLDDLEAGREVTPGPQNGRSCSCPDGGATSLTDASLYSGKDDVASAGVVALGAAALANTTLNATSAGSVSTSSPQMDEADQSASEHKGGKDLEQLEAEILAVEERVRQAQDKTVANIVSATEETPTGEQQDAETKNVEEVQPEGLSQPRDGKADDLKQIKGVGPKLETTLNGLGIYHFEQISVWSGENVAWVDNYLSFKGRIDREDWITQAQTLAKSVADQKGDA